jgi:hypothetical protein
VSGFDSRSRIRIQASEFVPFWGVVEAIGFGGVQSSFRETVESLLYLPTVLILKNF